ncbi:hypothetical protein HYU93_05210 [Candidatus Daviesbacteria bacterium]|nr:hypothetical protein [Candidatus Daviesbacteria bacterium]
MRNTKEIGDTVIAGVPAQMLKKGYAILLPLGDSQRYDLVVDINSQFYRIQCKNGRIRSSTASLA